ncbi:hypothetical protein BCR44DRAFT_60181 [Catenaria anguillulae PL171]|uniref:MYND-type domain-containing protein n=1 Tax=Catenaria anguillulae PL171 TaxID=765915 RepID=A0A1Y2HNG0_9FUNG|nr:hypothetical protein BCR44DRAFT_60181 [Catenaria anguillulae PL171]
MAPDLPPRPILTAAAHVAGADPVFASEQSQVNLPAVPYQINPLANPKNVKHGCELCGRPAHLVCPTCRCTYYCDKEHQLLDQAAIHEKICVILRRLRSPVPFLGSDQERKNKQKEILELRQTLLQITRTDAQKLLFEGEFAYAIPAALQALRSCIDIYGQHALELVPCYLLLGEASIGLKQYDQAEEYLASAKWSLTKLSPGGMCPPAVASKQPNSATAAPAQPSSTDVPSAASSFDSSTCAIQAKLSHNFGLLYLSRGHLRESVAHLSRAIFLSSQLHGPTGIQVSGGYFQLGQAFAAMDSTEGRHGATAAFAHVVETWAMWMIAQIKQAMHDAQGREDEDGNGAPPDSGLSEVALLVAAMSATGQTASKIFPTLNRAQAIDFLTQIGSHLDVAQRAECAVMFARIEEFFALTPRLLVKTQLIHALYLAATGDLAGAQERARNGMGLHGQGWLLGELDPNGKEWKEVYEVAEQIGTEVVDSAPLADSFSLGATKAENAVTAG